MMRLILAAGIAARAAAAGSGFEMPFKGGYPADYDLVCRSDADDADLSRYSLCEPRAGLELIAQNPSAYYRVAAVQLEQALRAMPAGEKRGEAERAKRTLAAVLARLTPPPVSAAAAPVAAAAPKPKGLLPDFPRINWEGAKARPRLTTASAGSAAPPERPLQSPADALLNALSNFGRKPPLPQTPKPAGANLSMPSAENPVPAVAGPLGARGSAKELAKIAAEAAVSLPDASARKAARALTLRATGAGAPGEDPAYADLDASLWDQTLGAYFLAQARKAEAKGPVWDAVRSWIALGFRRGMGLPPSTAVRVRLTVEDELISDRGLWIASPVIRAPDGSYDVVVNAQWAVLLSTRAVRESLRAAGDESRRDIVTNLLQRRNPEDFGDSLKFLMIGWTQARLTRRMAAELEGKTPQDEARARVMADVLRDPPQTLMYQSVLDFVSMLTKNRKWFEGDGRRLLSSPESYIRFEAVASASGAKRSELWSLVREANVGDDAALAKAMDAVTAYSADVVPRRDVLPFLDLRRPQARAYVEKRLSSLGPTDYSVFLLAPRLALSGDAAGVALFARHVAAVEKSVKTFSPTREAFLKLFLSAAARRPAVAREYEALLRELGAAGGSPGALKAALIGRSTLWEAVLLDPAARSEDLRALFAAAEPAVREKMYRVLAASRAPAAPARLAALRALPFGTQAAAATDDAAIAAERTSARAAALASQAQGLRLVETTQQEISARYSIAPQSVLPALALPGISEPLARAARRSGMDPYYLAAVAFQEGYILAADWERQGLTPRYDNYWPMGLDSFSDYIYAMKKNGQLRADFHGYKSTGRTNYNEARTLLHEVIFDTPADALEAMAGLIRLKQAQFLADARALGIDPRKLSRQDIEMWSYVYYNCRDPKSLLARYGIGWVWREAGPDSKALFNAKRVGATTELLRRLAIFG